jgi:hypothetical protein
MAFVEAWRALVENRMGTGRGHAMRDDRGNSA